MSIKTQMIAGAVALTAIAGLTGPARAQSGQNADWCVGKGDPSPDLMIGGCTAMIQAGTLSKGNLARAFNNRGSAYANKGQYDRAIQDYDQAIKLDPNFTRAINNRAEAIAKKNK